MSIFSKRNAAVGLLLAGAGVATAAAAGGVPSTMPAANPKDAAAAQMYAVQQTIPTSKLGGKANSYFYASNGGGQVKIARVTEKGFTSYQTVTITPPNTSPATTILQGFATLSGGNTGSRLITHQHEAQGLHDQALQPRGAGHSGQADLPGATRHHRLSLG